jgi:PAS domain S-box-containing protein
MIAGRTVVNYDSKTDLRTANDYERSYLPTGERTYVAVPLMRDDRWVASLWVSDNKPRHWSKEDVSLLETIAERTWTATEKLRIDAALRESQQRLSLTYSHAAIGLVETAPDSRILQCNDAYASVLGYTREELIGRSFLDITYEEDARREADLYRQLIEKQIPFYRFEKRFVKKDGALIWSEMVRTVVLDGNGNARFGIGAAFNIDERKQREEALRARTEEIETLMEVNPIGILVAHDPECNYITGNPTGYSLLGFSTDSTENLSKPRLDELKPSQSHRVFRDGVELSGDELPMQMSARLGMEIEEQELELRFEDGTQKYIYFYTKPLFDARGNTRGTVAAMLDITERRLNEEALKAAREKAEASASRIARLQEVTAALSAPLTPTQVAEVMIQKGVPSLGAAVGTMMEASPDGQTLMIRYSTAATLFVERFKHTPISMKTPASDAYSSGKLIWIESREQYLERYPHLAADIQNWKYQAALSIPMEYKGYTVGVLNLSFESITPYSREDEEFAITLARQGAQALERAKAEDSLRASEERYRAIINQTTVGILRKDRHGNMLFVNQAFCEMLGYNSVELIDKSIWEVTHPDDIEKNRELYNQMMRDGLPFRIEKRLIHRDGSIIWVLVSVSPLLDAEGKPQSAVSVYSDITLRKYAESELHRLNLELEDRVQLRTAQLQAANESLLESEATSRLILESMPDGIVIINKEGQVVYCNAQVETLFGYKPAEVLGQSVTQLIPERYQQALGLERELFGQRKDQTQFPADVLVSPISSRTTWDRIITIRDMTEQRLAQEAIRKNEEKLRSLFEVLPVGISFLDNEGNVTEMNSTLTHILGLSKTEIVEGKFRPRRYVRADGSPMPPREFASVRARTEQKPVYNVETGIVKENGQTLWTSVNAAPVDIADVDVVVATIDVTARKQVEDELHKSRERLRILSRRLVEVQEDERHAIARELHDRVGQNLAALNLNLNILRSQLSVEALQVIGTRLSDSVALVNQILGITRNVMADLRSDVLDEYGLESALREYADQFTQRTGIQVVSDKSATAIPRLDSSIEMTLLRIAQEALTNVARHAKANRATISIGADEDAVYMSIQDDGIGILSWQKANQPGSHGLRIIRERAEALGGSVQVHSAYKKGTNIEVKIPLSGSSYQSPREKRS